MWKRLLQLPNLELFGRTIPTKTVLIVVGVMIVGWNYHTHIIAPTWKRIGKLQKQVQVKAGQLQALKEKMPDLSEQERLVAEQRTLVQQLSQRLQTLEVASPKVEQLSELVKVLADAGAEHRVDFISSRLGEVDKSDLYERHPVTLEVIAPYEALVDYLMTLESLTPFGNVRLVETHLPEADAVPHSKIVYEILLGSVAAGEGVAMAEAAGQPPAAAPDAPVRDPFSAPPLTPEQGRDPFASPVKPLPVREPLKNYQVRGILHTGGRLTAIVNNIVVKVGDKIDGKVVESIDKNSVVLSEGTHVYRLSLGATTP